MQLGETRCHSLRLAQYRRSWINACQPLMRLEPAGLAILDNLSVHNSSIAAAALEERGAWCLFVPKYSPDPNPIEMAFSKLKVHLRRPAAHTLDVLRQAQGIICDLFEPHE